MKFLLTVLLAALVSGARADIVVIAARNNNQLASAEYKFFGVPPPRRSAAIDAAFSIVDGRRDGSSADVDTLRSLTLPDEEDEPGANFFFSPGSDGGRILIDLGKTIGIGEIDTYSWHPSSRGPQVYQLYASDGAAAGFVNAPARPRDPAQCGWKLIANVDTRAKYGQTGGQYGVSIRDSAAAAIGTYRYLLFDVRAANPADVDGNTFYSKIVILDANAAGNAAPLVAAVRTSSTYNQAGYQLVFDNDDSTFDPAETQRMVHTFFTIYPQLVAAFNKDAPREVRISVEIRYKGVAATNKDTIHISSAWFHHKPEDINVITHEATHVVQQYPHYDPVWLVEGIADYARYKFGVNNSKAGWSLPDYKPTQNFDNSYRITARFLAWLDKHVQSGIVQKLDIAMRSDTYTPDTWRQLTGKTVQQLWQDYAANPTL